MHNLSVGILSTVEWIPKTQKLVIKFLYKIIQPSIKDNDWVKAVLYLMHLLLFLMTIIDFLYLYIPFKVYKVFRFFRPDEHFLFY